MMVPDIALATHRSEELMSETRIHLYVNKSYTNTYINAALATPSQCGSMQAPYSELRFCVVMDGQDVRYFVLLQLLLSVRA